MRPDRAIAMPRARHAGVRRTQVDHCDMELSELVAKGKSQGYLTYDEVNDYLPDEAVDPEKLDSLLVALDEMGIELVTEAPEVEEELDVTAEDCEPEQVDKLVKIARSEVR